MKVNERRTEREKRLKQKEKRGGLARPEWPVCVATAQGVPFQVKKVAHGWHSPPDDLRALRCKSHRSKAGWGGFVELHLFAAVVVIKLQTA